jgi:formylglycine-generating enzyme required for sulfatase activity
MADAALGRRDGLQRPRRFYFLLAYQATLTNAPQVSGDPVALNLRLPGLAVLFCCALGCIPTISTRNGPMTRLMIFALAAMSFARCATAISIPTVPIANPGNPVDTRSVDGDHQAVGSVSYAFQMGQTEVTNAQYVPFLNAVAATDNYGLYSTLMGSETWGGIVRSGAPGSYTYSVKAPALSGTYTYEDKPVVYVSSGDAMRFANWLHNGQPSGPQDASTTEGGAYTLNGASSNAALAAVTRNAGARWWLPSEDEWYKAAYHKNDGPTGNFWEYPTGTDSDPDNSLPANDTGNSANFYRFDYTTGDGNYPLTDAGAYTLSDSPYGTFDQGGNVWEWNETLFPGPSRGARGGSWVNFSNSMPASFWSGGDPTAEFNSVGFRVASIPEPAGITLSLAGVAMLVLRRRA